MPQVLFGVLILMAVTVVGICVTKPVDQGQGFDHPGYPKKTIQQAPDGHKRHATIVVVTGCYGTLTAVFTLFCMVFGLTQHQKQGAAARVLVVAGFVYAGLFSLVVILYWNGLHTTISNLFGFPASTAVMLFVLGPSPIALVLIYMFTFSHWILLPQDEERFRTLVSRRRKEQAN
jgi:hypothetical protein